MFWYPHAKKGLLLIFPRYPVDPWRMRVGSSDCPVIGRLSSQDINSDNSGELATRHSFIMLHTVKFLFSFMAACQPSMLSSNVYIEYDVCTGAHISDTKSMGSALANPPEKKKPICLPWVSGEVGGVACMAVCCRRQILVS